MKPAPFAYLRPGTLAEACDALASDPDARILAGGQTLVPMLAMRLARPSLLVDVSRLEELIGIEEDGDGIVIRAATRQAAALASGLVRREVPLLAAALPHVGHPPTRARGTVGGSVAHGDPSAEIALAATILGAEIVCRAGDADESFAPDAFFIAPTVTGLPAAGVLTRLRFPRRPEGAVGAGFREVAARRSDYAVASAGAQVQLDADGTCARVWLGIGSVGDVPVAADVAGLSGTRLADDAIRDAVGAALAGLEVVDDLHATASYRRRAAARLAELALGEARDAALRAA